VQGHLSSRQKNCPVTVIIGQTLERFIATPPTWVYILVLQSYMAIPVDVGHISGTISLAKKQFFKLFIIQSVSPWQSYESNL